jgi:hypothetical protein
MDHNTLDVVMQQELFPLVWWTLSIIPAQESIIISVDASHR